MGSEQQVRVKPNLLLIGVHKAGTTSLFDYLSSHPEVCGSSIKEVHYYTPLRLNKEPEDFSSYLKNFSKCKNERYIFEASPSYFYGKGVIAKRIKEDLGNVKIILILRDPTERLLSFYKSLKATLRIDQNMRFKEFMEKSVKNSDNKAGLDVFSRGFAEGLYSEYLKEWFDNFENDDFRIVFFENLKNDPMKFMSGIAGWLDIDNSFYTEQTSFNISNKTVIPRYKGIHKVSISLNKKMEKFLRPHKVLKQFIRKIYFSMNKENGVELIPEELKKNVRDLYKSDIDKLTTILGENKVTDLPEWLGI